MHTERGFDRLVNFSDAVVAIAITLLILPLVDTASQLGDSDLGQLLDTDGSKLLVFVISFAVIGRFWIAHHRMYENMIGYDLGILWVNLLWLLTIVFLPFPTELIARDGGSSNPTTTALYVGTMLATSLVGSWQQWLFVRRPQLQAEPVRGTLRLLPAFTSTAMMALAFVTVVVVPQVGLFALFLLALTAPAQRLADRVLGRGRFAHPATTRPNRSGSPEN